MSHIGEIGIHTKEKGGNSVMEGLNFSKIFRGLKQGVEIKKTSQTF